MAELRALQRILKRVNYLLEQTDAVDESSSLESIETQILLSKDEWQEYLDIMKNKGGKDFEGDNLIAASSIEDKIFSLKKSLTEWKLIKLQDIQIATGNSSKNLSNDTSSSLEALATSQQIFFDKFANLNLSGSRDSPELIKTPQLSIPPFHGCLLQFPNFKGLFEAAIHNNTRLPSAVKLQYLKSLMQGDAEGIIKHIPISEDNYAEAWKKVCDRFDKREFYIHDLIKKFMNQSTITSSDRSLRSICDVSDEVIRGLKVLGNEAEKRDPWLIFIISQKLDFETKKAWAEKSSDVDFPSFESFLKFLTKRCDAFEVSGSALNTPRRAITERKPTYHKSLDVNAVSSAYTQTCLCTQNHLLSDCPAFMKLAPNERRDVVARERRCFRCLRMRHRADQCRFQQSCSICYRRHHTLIHIDGDQSQSDSNPFPTSSCTSDSIPPSTLPPIFPNSPSTSQHNQNISGSIINNNAIIKSSPSFRSLLPTALVFVNDICGNMQTCKILLDSGSVASFISQSCIQRLKLPRQNARYSLSGLACEKGPMTKGFTSLNISSRYNHDFKLSITALILDKLPSNIPTVKFNQFSDFSNLELADPTYNIPSQIDIVLGIDQYFKLKQPELLFDAKNNITAENTAFGWVLGGSLNSTPGQQFSVPSFQTELDHTNIDKTLRNFWEIEEVGAGSSAVNEIHECEKLFESTHTRSVDGRFIVRLPMKADICLGTSIKTAIKRFMAVEKRMQSNENLKSSYIEFMDEYEALGHMSKLSDDEVRTIQSTEHYYLPHHAVFREASTTTKTRVVFDGSAPSSNGVSVNNKLLVGPTIQATLFTILLRFRSFRIALTADIAKMYRQVLVHPADQRYQLIVWRKDPQSELQHYRLNTVTYGLTSAPFLAIRALNETSSAHGHEFPLATSTILRNFYVDDMLGGADDEESARELKDQIQCLLNKGRFELRKWKSNIKGLSDADDIKSTQASINISDSSEGNKVLGILWHPSRDIFSFRVDIGQEQLTTKRNFLSDSSRIFDPLGWLSPTVIAIKVMFQEVWILKLSWDDTLPNSMLMEWNKFKSELDALQHIEIPRFIMPHVFCEFHVFADASKRAYAAVVYCRSMDASGGISVHLVAAKTKVSPIKELSIPRLELCAAQLGAKLLASITSGLENQNCPLVAWSDSTSVLGWVNGDAASNAKRDVYVRNRISCIRSNVPQCQWRYIPTKINPADCATRGVSPARLPKMLLWWKGPTFLEQPQEAWPETLHHELSNTTIEKDETFMSDVGTNQTNVEENFIQILCTKYSSFFKLQRALCHIIRYVKWIRSKTKPDTTYLTPKDLNEAEKYLIKWAQREIYASEISSLQRYQVVSTRSPIISLTPYLDEDQILRVGGRLQNSQCAFTTKHPIILPFNNSLSKIIVSHFHQNFHHPGPSLTSYLIKQRFWIVNCRRLVRAEVKNCVTCIKERAHPVSQIMGNLPSVRVTPSRPFSNTGVDFAGPIPLASKRGRGSKTLKGYISVFVCMATKAVHLEVVSDLSTDAFVAALTRFIKRRGQPSDMYCDNGRNFVGSKRYLNDLHDFMLQNTSITEVVVFLSKNRTNWHMIPPSAPHFGGLWESAVRIMKEYLKRAIGCAALTYEELSTLLCEIEAMMNSRPLCPMSEDPSSLNVLTPGHFLYGEASPFIPQPELSHLAPHQLSRWQHITRISSSFWQRFQTEYLQSLQQRNKWRRLEDNLKINDIVTIKEENLPPGKWLMARVVDVFPGEDGKVRVALVKTVSGIYKRPISKLCKLFSPDDQLKESLTAGVCSGASSDF